MQPGFGKEKYLMTVYINATQNKIFFEGKKGIDDTLFEQTS